MFTLIKFKFIIFLNIVAKLNYNISLYQLIRVLITYFISRTQQPQLTYNDAEERVFDGQSRGGEEDLVGGAVAVIPS